MAAKPKSKKAPLAPARKAAAAGSGKGAKGARPKRSKTGIIVGLLLVAGLIGQGAYVYLANKKKDAVLFFEGQIAARGSGKGEVEGARNLAVSDNGDVVYAFGVGEGSVLQAYTSAGKFIARYEAKRKPEALNNVFAMAYAQDGSLWACERGTGRVLHLSAKLDFLGSFVAPSTDLPGIAVDAKGQIWVASNGPKIYVFNAKGDLQQEFKGTHKAPLVGAYRLTFDTADNLLVLDNGRGGGKDPDVKIYAPDGKSIGLFMAKGLPYNEFSCIGADQGYAVLNNNGTSGTDSQGIFLFKYTGKVAFRCMTTSNQLSLMNVPGLAIGRKGHWALDMTPVGRGCDRFSFSALE